MDNFGQNPDAVAGGLLAMAGIGAGIGLLVLAVILISMWKIFTKAGRPGWEGIIPIYNMYILMTEILKKPTAWFWIFLGGIVGSMIPFLGFIIGIGLFVFGIIINIELAKTFGKTTIFGVLMALFGIIFYPILAFGSAQYTPPVDQSEAKLGESFNL